MLEYSFEQLDDLDRVARVCEPITRCSVAAPPSSIRPEVMVGGDIELHNISFVPEFDENGRIVSVLGIGRDMTELDPHAGNYCRQGAKIHRLG